MRHEPLLDAGKPVIAGPLYVVNGKPTVSTVTGTVATLAAAIGGSPAIAQIDVPSRMTQTDGIRGLDVFET